MARAVDVGGCEVHREDGFRCDPRGLKVDWRKNVARAGQEPEVDDDLKALALDMMPKQGPGDSETGSSGQLNPILCRMLQDRTVEVVGGFRRMKAALWLVESGTCPDFEIRYRVCKMNDAEAALAQVSENLQREDPGPVQLAHSVRCLHEDYGLDMNVIALRLKRTETWLNKILDLTTLPTKIQDSVAKGKTAVNAALEIAKQPSDQQVAVFNEAKDSGGRVTHEAVKDRVRETSNGSTPRTARHLKAFLEPYCGKGNEAAPLAKAILGFLEGKAKSEEKLQKVWDEMFAVTA